MRAPLYRSVVLFFILIPCLKISLAQDNDAVYLKMLKEYRLNDDGSITYHHRHELQLLTYFAFSSRYGETFIVYDTLYQSFKGEITSITTMANGKRIPSPANAFNLVLPRFASNAPSYNHLRELVITHTGLERNAIVELDYTLQTKPGYWAGFMDDLLLAEDSPINDLTIRLIIPRGQFLNYRLLNSNLKAGEREEAGEKIYEWQLKNVPPIALERMQEAPGNFSPRLIFSTVASLNESLAALISLIKSPGTKIMGLQTLLSEFKEQGLNGLDLILKLHQVFVVNTATFPVAHALIGFRSRTPEEVWNSNGGTLLEKSVLLSAALSSAGFEAYPVLVADENYGVDYPAALQAFERSLVMVVWDGNTFYLPTDKSADVNQGLIYSGRYIAVLKPAGVETFQLPTLSAHENCSVLDCFASVDSGGEINARLNIKLSGALNPYLQIRQNHTNAEKLIRSIVADSDIKKVEWTEIGWQRCEFVGEVMLKDGFKKQDNYLFWELPKSSSAMGNSNFSNITPRRLTGLQLPFPLQDKNTFLVKLSKGIELVTNNFELKKNNPIGSIFLSLQQTGEEILIERRLEFSKSLISVEEYPDFFELWREWEDGNHRLLIFSSNGN